MGELEVGRIPRMIVPFSVLLTRAGFPEKKILCTGGNDDAGILLRSYHRISFTPYHK